METAKSILLKEGNNRIRLLCLRIVQVSRKYLILQFLSPPVFLTCVNLYLFIIFIQAEKVLLAQKKMELESSKASAQTLRHDLDMACKQMKVLEQQVVNLQLETKRLSETANHLREDKVKLEAELEDQKRSNSSLELASDSL
jgi:septal ring factor EnvC (AmiA/AmiB activator)